MPQPVRGETAGREASLTRVLAENSDVRDSSTLSIEATRSSYRQPPGLPSQTIFHRILCCERKRAERSGKCILLMLADAEGVFIKPQARRVFPGIVSALCSPTRETDIVGWYEEHTVLGVIFTDLDEANRSRLQALMSAEVTARLRTNLGQEAADQVYISFHLFPEGRDNSAGGVIDEKIYPDLRERAVATKPSHVAKRAIDIVASALAIIAFSPLFILIAAAIKLTSKGPVLFKQERIGQYGRRFTFLKFRSMKCGSDPLIHKEYVRRFIGGEITAKGERVTYKIKEDPRHTRIGAFLRKCSLDELPQLFNVLKGEMSLVGPRPAIPYEIDFYQVWHRARFLQAKPGITGLWQVTGRSRTTFDDMVRLDLRYAKQWSLWLDIKILFHTPRAILSGEGAY